MACTRCGGNRKPVQVPSGVRAGTNRTPAITARPDNRPKGVKESITGLRYVPSGK